MYEHKKRRKKKRSHDDSVICRWNKEGRCKFGVSCKYIHRYEKQKEDYSDDNRNKGEKDRKDQEGNSKNGKNSNNDEIKRLREEVITILKKQVEEEIMKIRTEYSGKNHFLYQNPYQMRWEG